MSPQISDTYMFLPTAKAIKDANQQTYSKNQDAASGYKVKVKAGATKLGTRSVAGIWILENAKEQERRGAKSSMWWQGWVQKVSLGL